MASVAHWSLDVAADSQEELQDWVKKIREVAQTADARVRHVWGDAGGSLAACEPLGGARPAASGPALGRGPWETHGASPAAVGAGHGRKTPLGSAWWALTCTR